MSEFPQYSEREVLDFSLAKLQLIYKEALRQRASKYELLASMILRPNLTDEGNKKLESAVNKLLNPHKIVATPNKRSIEDSWAAMRMRRNV